MRSRRDRRSSASGKNRDWDDWQRYVRKETQRLMQKSGKQVVEVSFAEPEARKPPEEPAANTATQAPEPYEGRRPPVPGVPREEALELSNEEIGRTVKPYTVDDYRNIRPLTSSDIFDTGGAAGVEIHVQDPVEIPTQPVSAVEPIPVHEFPVEQVAPEKDQAKKRRGRIKKKDGEGGPGLFDSVSEHQLISRQRLTKKSKLVREELIEKLLDPVISLEEASTLIGVCKTTVRRYTNKGELECLRTPGQQRRFKLSQVLAFVKKREEDQKSRGDRMKKGK